MNDTSSSAKEIPLLGKWVGDAYGTHRLLVFVEYIPRDGKYYLELRVAPPGAAARASIFVGQVNDALTKIGTQMQSVLTELADGQFTTLTLTLNIQAVSEDALEGDWQSSDNAKGIIHLSRHKSAPHTLSTLAPASEPVEIVAKEYKFNALRIYKGDIEEIITIMEQLTKPDGNIFVTEEYGETKRTTFARTYLAKEKKAEELHGMIIGAHKNTNGFNSSLVLNLRQNDPSNLLVTSPDLFWFYNTPMAIKELLDKKSSRIIDAYRKHGLSINFVVFLMLLVWMPSLEIRERIFFVCGFFVFAFLHVLIQRKSSRSVINQKRESPSTVKEKYPAITYIVLTIFSAMLGAVVKIALDKATAAGVLSSIFG